MKSDTLQAALRMAAISALVMVTTAASAQLAAGHRKLVIPQSSESQPGDLGVRAHTNIRLITTTEQPNEAPPYLGYGFETPASLACVYRLVQPIHGCNPNQTTATPQGGSQSIAVVDAYDDPNALGDLAAFSDQFGVPFDPSQFVVAYESGTPPPADPTGGWELEESVDIEYAHAMAPHAKIYLVEANSNYYSDLFTAVIEATNLVQCGQQFGCPPNSTGKGEVSMSWGGGEFTQETQLDPYLAGTNVVYVAAAGDSPGVEYPSASPNVVSAGGTTTARSLATGNLIQEIAWSDGGGGSSQVEPRPGYQRPIAHYAGATRATPDVSSDANPTTGVWVFDSYPYDGILNPSDWWTVGGTSVAAPTITGILNAAATQSGHFAASTNEELTQIYLDLAIPPFYNAAFNDITYGACNYYSSTFSDQGYDFCTGVGSIRTLFGK